MLFVPLPFVVALLLVVLFWAVVRNRDETTINRPFLALVLLAALQSVLTGLRWGYGVAQAGYVAPVLAAMMPALLYAGVGRLVREDRRQWPAPLLAHALPALVVTALVFTWREAIDTALIAIDFLYAAATLWLLRSGADGLRLAPFEGAVPAYRAILFAAAALCLSGMVDMLVSFALAAGQETRAAFVVGIANLLLLVLVGTAAATASRSNLPANAPELANPSAEPSPGEDAATIARLVEVLGDGRLYRDAGLNLNRLARGAGIPARRISSAINRMTGKNVSQYVNEYRIAEACRLLRETDQPVTEIMLAAGFQTKSNFNREFRRVTGMTPLAWRETNAPSLASAIPG